MNFHQCFTDSWRYIFKYPLLGILLIVLLCLFTGIVLLKKGLTKYDYGKVLQKLENEIKLINNNIDQMYIDKLNNKISEEMYERLLKKFGDEIKQKEKEYMETKQQKEAKQDDTEKIKSIVQDFLSLNKPTSEIMKVIINRIEIHQDKQVDLYFNFKQLNNLKEKM